MSPSEARVADPYRDESIVDLRDPVDVSFTTRHDTMAKDSGRTSVA